MFKTFIEQTEWNGTAGEEGLGVWQGNNTPARTSKGNQSLIAAINVGNNATTQRPTPTLEFAFYARTKRENPYRLLFKITLFKSLWSFFSFDLFGFA